MTKRIIALFLCLTACVAVFAGCAGSIPADSEDKGQQITMYLTENIYNLDPAYAFTNEATKSIVGMLFDTLFTVDEKGKVTASLAESYKTETTDDGEYFMYIEIREDACWSDNQPLTADDVVFAWKRLLNPNNAYSSASLLFDIKNAREYNEAEVSKDDLGISADGKHLTIEFEGRDGEPDYDQFLLNLTSLALAPLREDVVSKSDDWAKKPGVMVTSGPFKLSKLNFYKGTDTFSDIEYDMPKVDEDNKVVLDRNGDPIYIDATVQELFKTQRVSGFVLERNLYYYRNAEDAEALDVSVTPYRIIVDCGMTDEELEKAYNEGIVLYVGDIPMSIRTAVKDEAKVCDSLSTNVCYLNQNAFIADGSESGYKLFANAAVRQALSMAVDREAIAQAVVFAEAATGLVPTGMYDTNSPKKLFRDNAGETSKNLSFDMAAAKALLSSSDIDPSDYSFAITVAAYDEVHMYIAEALVAAWGSSGLGFNVSLNARGTVANNDYHKDVKGIPSDLCDDLWAEDLLRGNFEVVILDLVAPTADPFSVLAPFAKAFSGQKMDMSDSENYQLATHITGYDSAEYNEVTEKIFKNKDIASRSADLHAAEDILMKDMPAIPIIFNQSAYLINEDVLDLNNKVLFWDKAAEYYYPVSFDKAEVKDYDDYCVKCAEYIVNNFDAWKTNPASYFGDNNYAELSVAEFITQNSNYLYLFKDKDYDFLPAPAEKQEAEK